MYQRVKAPQQRPATLELQPTWREAEVEDGFCVVAVGDIIITHAIAQSSSASRRSCWQSSAGAMWWSALTKARPST